MSTPFSRTMRALDADLPRWGVLAAVGVTLACWLGWFCFVPVTVWVGTDVARIEVAGDAHPLDAPVAGRVLSIDGALDARVVAGDVIVTLDASDLSLQLQEAEARGRALDERQVSLRAAKGVTEQALVQESVAGTAARAEAEARVRAGQAAAMLAEADATRATAVYATGGISTAAHEEAVQGAVRAVASTEALATGVQRETADRALALSERRAELESILEQLAQVAGEAQATTATIARLRWEIDRYSIRAPTEGRIGDLAPLHVGDLVAAGTRLGAVVPEGELRVVGQFAPADSVGRVAPGQRARVRLDGFPWTEFGSLAATVSAVAAQPRSGRIRVDLAVERDPDSAIPLQHGLTGRAEVAVEEARPVELVLRAAGSLVRRRTGP